MVVQINFERSEADHDRGQCRLVLENPEKGGGDTLGTYRGYAGGARVNDPGSVGTWWMWENPQEPLKDVTFSPSLITYIGDRQMFHIFIRDGKVEHCGDCECGCRE